MWKIEKTDQGYRWMMFQSAYGSAGGIEPTLAQAKVELAIAEADIMEHPFPPSVVKMMRKNPEEVAADLPDVAL